MFGPETLQRDIAYLAAKRSIDDLALNHHVWQTLWSQPLPDSPRILEAGAGIGTMLERLLEQDRLRTGHYLAIDQQPAFLAEARARHLRWGEQHGLSAESDQQRLHLRSEQVDLEITYLQTDLAELSAAVPAGSIDLLLGHALLDLVDLASSLPGLLGCLTPAGLFHFSLNFDGVTSFQPEVDPELDRRIAELYHTSMDERQVGGLASGDSRTGRRLLGWLVDNDQELLAAGGSDWVVHPRDHAFASDERILLETILVTIERQLQGHPALDAKAFSTWLATRRTQLAEGRLVFLTHQLDVVGRRR